MAKQSRKIDAAKDSVSFPNGTLVSAAPFLGQITQWTNDTKSFRSIRLPAEEDMAPGFSAALEELGIYEQETIHLDVHGSNPKRGRGYRSAAGRDEIILRPSSGAAGQPTVQVVLYQDESGGLSWHFPDGFLFAKTASSGLRASRGAAVFTIPARTIASEKVLAGPRPPSSLRGPITKWGRKIFKVLLIPVLTPLLEKPLENIVEKIEKKHRQELIRALTPEDYQNKITAPFTDWKKLSGKRSLLIVHGLFSSTEGMLSLLPQQVMEEFYQHYDKRVLGFDQLTVSRSPEENARFFLEHLKKADPSGNFEFDILCHSRGGIVSRVLAEMGNELVPDHNCTFRKVFFVATPNQGSVLADPEHIVDMLDVFTNLMTDFPDGPLMYSIEVLLAIIKVVAYTAGKSLPGVAAMGTESYINQVLNRHKPDVKLSYAAAAADYEPDPRKNNAFFTGRFVDYTIDRIFTKDGKAVSNDLVVPQAGVYGANGHPFFPIKDPLIYSASEHVWHSGFFARARTVERMREHFEIESQLAMRSKSPQADDSEERKRRSGLRRKSQTAAEDLSGSGRGAFRGSSKTSRSPGKTATRTTKGKAKPPRELKRKPAIDFHEQVREGEEHDLIVRLEDVIPAEPGLGDFISIALEEGKSQVELQVSLNATGFDVSSPRESTMVVKASRDAEREQVVFTLTARHPGPAPVLREIHAGFWLHNSCIGSVTHRTYVVPKGYADEAHRDGTSVARSFFIPASRRDDCDFRISVSSLEESGEPPFYIRLSSQIPGNAFTDRKAGKLSIGSPSSSLAEYLDQFLEKQFQKYPDHRYLSDKDFDAAVEAWEEELNEVLNALGKTLWQKLPQQLQDAYFDLYQDGCLPRSILIHSDEMILPWELLIPHKRIKGELVELPPLGAAHVLGRWKPGLKMMPYPQRLEVKNFCVVNPNYPPPDDLPWSLDEVDALRSLFPRLTPISPADLSSIRTNLLGNSNVQIFHYTGHGDYNPHNADLNSLILENNDSLDAIMINGSRLAVEACPIVYLNACSVGKTGAVLGRMGGFVANFLDSGCSAVIAPYWPINDKRGMDFALGLYRKLKQGRAIGEALQELRLENPKDPTFRSFAFFGDPWARMNFAAIVKRKRRT